MAGLLGTINITSSVHGSSSEPVAGVGKEKAGAMADLDREKVKEVIGSVAMRMLPCFQDIWIELARRHLLPVASHQEGEPATDEELIGRFHAGMRSSGLDGVEPRVRGAVENVLMWPETMNLFIPDTLDALHSIRPELDSCLKKALQKGTPMQGQFVGKELSMGSLLWEQARSALSDALQTRSLPTIILAVTLFASGKRADELHDLMSEQQARQAQMADLNALSGALSGAVAKDDAFDPDAIWVELHPGSPMHSELGPGPVTVTAMIEYYRKGNSNLNLPEVPHTIEEARAAQERISGVVTGWLQGLSQNAMLELQKLQSDYHRILEMGSNMGREVAKKYENTI